MKKISIILLVKEYNLNNLRICLHNLINQTFDDFEIILLIDDSLNEIIKIKEFVKDNFSTVNIVENNVDLNVFIDTKINCEFVLFSESNSWFELDALEKLYENGKNNDSDVVIFDSNMFNNKNKSISYLDKSFNFNEIEDVNLYSISYIGQKMYKKSFLIQNDIIPSNLFNFSEEIIFLFNSFFNANAISYLKYQPVNIKNNFNNELKNYFIEFNKVKSFLTKKYSLNNFDQEFYSLVINYFKNYLDFAPKEFKNKLYTYIREYFLTLNINSNILKNIEYCLSTFYINCLNCKSYSNFKNFNKTIKKKINYINKNDIKQYDKYGINFEKRNKKIIVSLTSIPDRLYDLHYCLHSLFNQTYKPDKIILWLSKDEFPKKEDDIPEEILSFKKYGLTIEWCDNIKSYKKLLPALQMYPNDYIVTADDDIYFPKNWLETLWKEHEKYSDCLISFRSRKIAFNKKNNSIQKYQKWKLFKKGVEPSFLNFPTNGAGTLFFPNSLSDNVFNKELFSKLSPLGDDIWIWAMAVLNNTKIKVVENPIYDLNYVNPAREFDILDETTLWSINNTYNDFQLNSVLNYFPEILNKISHK